MVILLVALLVEPLIKKKRPKIVTMHGLLSYVNDLWRSVRLKCVGCKQDLTVGAYPVTGKIVFQEPIVVRRAVIVWCERKFVVAA